MESKNPFFKTKSFTNTSSNATSYEAKVIDHNDTMTVSGTVNKTFLMLLLLVASAFGTWTLISNGYNPMMLAIGGAIIGFVLVLISSFKPHLSTFLAPAYALFEGLFIGAISAIFEAQHPGIVINAVTSTFVTFLVCLGLYKYRIVKVTEKFRSIVIAATVAIAVYYLGAWIFTLIFKDFQPVHHGNSWMSIGVSVFVIIIASLNLFLDFDQIEKGVADRMPKYMEWYGAMGLTITLVWLYIEFLRLLSKLGRD